MRLDLEEDLPLQPEEGRRVIAVVRNPVPIVVLHSQVARERDAS